MLEYFLFVILFTVLLSVILSQNLIEKKAPPIKAPWGRENQSKEK